MRDDGMCPMVRNELAKSPGDAITSRTCEAKDKNVAGSEEIAADDGASMAARTPRQDRAAAMDEPESNDSRVCDSDGMERVPIV